jgi:hypothetical protein
VYLWPSMDYRLIYYCVDGWHIRPEKNDELPQPLSETSLEAMFDELLDVTNHWAHSAL